MAESQVETLHGCLLEAMAARREPLNRPFTVREIYQELVPYRNVRAALGVELYADYEHVLLRLLAGEGGFLRLEPAEAREALRLELDSPHPDVGAFRRFERCEVWIERHRAGDGEGAPERRYRPARPSPEARRPEAAGPSSPAAPPARPSPEARRQEESPPSTRARHPEVARPSAPTGDPAGPSSPAAPPTTLAVEAPSPKSQSTPPPPAKPQAPPPSVKLDWAETPPAAAEAAIVGPAPEGAPGDVAPAGLPERESAPGVCRSCGAALPGALDVQYCPFCGADQRRRPCPNCGELLERSWKFCISCGTPAA
ncbi:MAG: zinc ribbon domain-containing protein [Gemmatimonadetes bacterium]|nr:zinc ribbon domain-containing protein [Gemmatimonadota bacterium]